MKIYGIKINFDKEKNNVIINNNNKLIDNFNYNINVLIEKLKKITNILVPYLDRKIEELKNQVKTKELILKKGLDELKSFQSELKKLVYMKEKYETQIDILEIIYDLVSSINIGDQTKKTILKDIKKFDLYSLETLKEKKLTYEKVKNKFFQF